MRAARDVDEGEDDETGLRAAVRVAQWVRPHGLLPQWHCIGFFPTNTQGQ
jgi:hypothetical protein